ncbi:MAG: hypothetical protein LBG80_01790 [Bacteroidales bacterium]|jgi:hypothetical protein|nr:hypothetical protein [Bacteroidales bacterium]
MKYLVYIILFFLLFYGCNTSTKEGDDNMIAIVDSNNNNNPLKEFNFFFKENKFSIKDMNNLDNLDKIKNNWIVLKNDEINRLLIGINSIDFKGSVVHLCWYRVINKSILLVVFYVENLITDGYLFILYDDNGNIKDYIFSNYPSWGDVIAQYDYKEIRGYKNKRYKIKEDTLIFITSEIEDVFTFEPERTDTIYKKSVFVEYLIKTEIGKFKQIKSDSIIEGNKFHY